MDSIFEGLDSIPDPGLVMNLTSTQSGATGSSGSRRRGNTGNPPPKRASATYRYCFTWNLKYGSTVPRNDRRMAEVPGGTTVEHWPMSEEEEAFVFQAHQALQKFLPLCKKLVYQFERGEEDYKVHVQGYCSLRQKKRITQLIKLDFFKDTGIHFEVPHKKSTEAKAIAYCMKEHTRIVGQPTCRHGLPETVTYTFKLDSLRPWQQKLWDILIGDPNPRDIYWIYEELGNTGKSTFAKHCVCNLPDCAVLNGKASDVMNAVLMYLQKHKKFLKTIICDIPRSTIGDKGVCISYGGFENIKNGCFYSGKYEGGMVVGPNPHMVIFANCRPDPGKFSEDRVRLYEIIGEDMELRNY